MLWTIVKAVMAAGVLVAVTELAGRFPRAGALILTLPLVSILAFILAWTKEGEAVAIAPLARETLILVPLGLPVFVPLAFSERTGLTFWPSLLLGILLASITIGLWLWLGPASDPPPQSPDAVGPGPGTSS